jgi:hypothetical protein
VAGRLSKLKFCTARKKLDSERVHPISNQPELESSPAVAGANHLNLHDRHAILSVLESDQLVAAKRRTHFGTRKLSFGIRALLWTLRVYVVVMMLLALISVLRAAHVIQ